VFTIAVSPKDGDVWMGTDMGLARYSEKRQDWDYYSRASGLPSDQVQSIAFDDNGELYAGTQCSGIAIAGPDDDYTKWRTITAPTPVPAAPAGEGLASNLINDIRTIHAGNAEGMMAVTPHGTAVMPGGDKWMFIRGADWKDHTAGPYADSDDSFQGTLPTEDWATALYGTGTHLWVGYRKMGVESRNTDGANATDIAANVKPPGTVIIRAILALPDQPPFFACYDGTAGGLLTLANAPAYKPAATGIATNAAAPALPAEAPIPTVDEGKVLATPLGKLTNQLIPGEAYYLADDWRTEGDWIGRYGSGYAKLCGMAQGDQDYALEPGYEVKLQMGPHHEENAARPVSFHDDEVSKDMRSLYDPALGYRRDAEENDFSDNTKTYPESYNGPDLWVRVTVPDGVHCLSLYFYNNDAHDKSEAKYRDYDVDVLPSYADDNKVDAATPLARTRVTDFWGGVYKQFLVCGPTSYVVRIGRDRSYGTRLQGVFLDQVTGSLPETPIQLPGFDTAPYLPPDEPQNYKSTPLTDAAVTLWNKLDDDLALRSSVALQMPMRIWCYRAAVAGGAPAALLEKWRWTISIWTPDDRKKFDDSMKAAYDTIK
jgi:hypothetical protein